MNHPNSPLRLLAKTYANDLISREQYIEIRAQLLKRLEFSGKISESEMRNSMALIQSQEPVSTHRRYTFSDWVLIALGLVASAVLAYVLYG
ncbi:MAG: hypothetical protein GY785_16335 [Gammaproteobacteria bacterium]|nr:hypothetical protein [Gammaproteobacteria bacterium]